MACSVATCICRGCACDIDLGRPFAPDQVHVQAQPKQSTIAAGAAMTFILYWCPLWYHVAHLHQRQWKGRSGATVNGSITKTRKVDTTMHSNKRTWAA